MKKSTYFKKMMLFPMTALLAAYLLTACGNAENTVSQTEDSGITESATETDVPMGTDADDTASEAAGEEAPEAVETPENAEELFTVDITDNLSDTENIIIGNTASPDAYCGMIEIHLEETLLERAKEIKVGSTYVFTVKPMMTMSIPPQVVAVDFAPAGEADLEALEAARREVSNFNECMENYQEMSLEDIIADANFNYPIWTQEEIAEYNRFITEKGYTEGSSPVSYVKLRAELNGSMFGASMTEPGE